MKISARHYARMGTIQYLYWWNFRDQRDKVADEQCLIDCEVLLHGDASYLQKLISSIPPRIPKINKLLNTVIHRNINSVDPVERAILQLGAYELMYQSDVPPKVITNECIELSREFGNPDSYKFINGTLDKIAFGEKSVRKFGSLKKKRSSRNREIDLVDKYFKRLEEQPEDVVTGIGDDCAVVKIPEGEQLVVSTDSLLKDVHFPGETAAEDVGYKSLAVSLSDLASMGAKPAFATLNLTVPKIDNSWLESFSSGFFELAEKFNVSLIGGDTVRGPLNIGVTVYGFAKSSECVYRSNAKVGDGIFVTGNLGDAALGLLYTQQGLGLTALEFEYLKSRINRPSPRVEAGLALRSRASSAIDVSDGLISDLSRILEASGVGAEIQLEQIPISATYWKVLKTVGWDYALAYGDDYELCFTLPVNEQEKVRNLMLDIGVSIHQIGKIKNQTGLSILDMEGKKYQPNLAGYSHF